MFNRINWQLGMMAGDMMASGIMAGGMMDGDMMEGGMMAGGSICYYSFVTCLTLIYKGNVCVNCNKHL